MANIKFSDFTANADIVQADHFLVGFDDDDRNAGANPKNNKWTFAQVAAGLVDVTATPYSLYASDGILAATERKIGIPSNGVLKIQNADGTPVDLLNLKEDGQIAIGKGAIIQSTSNPQNNVVIGTGAKDRSSAGNASESIAIGRLAVGNSGSVGVGAQAKCTGTTSTSIGSQSEAKNNGVSLGHQAGGPNAGASAVSLGRFAQAKANGSIAIVFFFFLTGANSIVLNATTSVTSSTAADTFEVFMTSSSAPDFTVSGINGMTPPSFSSNPSSPSAGNVIYNTTDNKLKFYNGSAWTDAGGVDNIFTDNAIDTSTVPSGREIDLTDNLTVQAGHGVYFSVNNTVAGYGDIRLSPPSQTGGSEARIDGAVLGNIIRKYTSSVKPIAIGNNSGSYVSINKPGAHYFQNAIAALEVASPNTTLPAIVARAGSDVSTGISFKSIDNSGNTLLEITGDGVAKYTGQAYTELNTISSASTITPDWNDGNTQTVELTSASTTIADPSNIKVGATYMLILKQDGTGSRTVSFGSKYKFSGGTAPTLTTGANKADVITLVAYSANILMCTSVLDFVTS